MRAPKIHQRHLDVGITAKPARRVDDGRMPLNHPALLQAPQPAQPGGRGDVEFMRVVHQCPAVVLLQQSEQPPIGSIGDMRVSDEFAVKKMENPIARNATCSSLPPCLPHEPTGDQRIRTRGRRGHRARAQRLARDSHRGANITPLAIVSMRRAQRAGIGVRWDFAAPIDGASSS